MEKPNTVRHHHGTLRLPPGFRFHPTDEELVVQYLMRKVFSCPLPSSVIPEINLAKYNPWDLLGGSNGERYYFSLREAKYHIGNRSNRTTGSGYWKATGKEKPIASSSCKGMVGMKKILVFYKGRPPSGLRTDWVMHEYRLTGPESGSCNFPQRKNSTHNTNIAIKDWVLCRIFTKKRATQMDVEEPEQDIDRVTGLIDFMGRSSVTQAGGTSAPSGSDSSCVTDFSDRPIGGDETNSSSISSSP